MFELSFAAPGVLPVSFVTTLPEPKAELTPTFIFVDDLILPPRPK